MVCLTTLLAVVVLGPSAAGAKPKPPQELAQQSMQQILSDMAGRREELRNNPDQLRALIEKDLVPHMDLDYIAQLTLGRYARQASEAQRQTFKKALKNMLIQNYGDALLKLKGGQNMEYKPVRAPDDAERITFNAVYHSPKGQDVHMSLKLHRVDDQWKVYDATGENLSFIANYRNQFTSRIKRVGLDKFIQQMKDRYGTT